jgi:hypothetical protein
VFLPRDGSRHLVSSPLHRHGGICNGVFRPPHQASPQVRQGLHRAGGARRASSTLPTRMHNPRLRPTTTRTTTPRRAKMSQLNALIYLPAQAPWSDWLQGVSSSCSCWLSAQLEITKSGETWEGESKETWQVSRNVSGTEGKHGRYAPAMSL